MGRLPVPVRAGQRLDHGTRHCRAPRLDLAGRPDSPASARAREMMSAKRAGVVPGGAKPKYLPWTRALTAHPIVTHIDRSQCLANMCCDLAPMREDNRLVGRPLPRRAIE